MKYITHVTGTVSYAGLVCGRSVLPDQLLPEHLGVTDTCQHVADMSSSCQAPEFGSGTFSHKFGFRSAYHHSRHQDTRVPVGGYEVMRGCEVNEGVRSVMYVCFRLPPSMAAGSLLTTSSTPL